MNLKRSLHLSLLLLSTLATAVAEVPSLINYQGRLVTADGAAQSGQKTFLLEVFDAASGGTLLYREEIGAITLGEGGVYSFQFGGTGTSNTQVTETIGTGGEGVLYQQVLSNLPMVAGSVSVSDGTYTWSQASGSSNEDDFSAAFSTNLNRITVNYFSGAPNDGRSIDVTYRYESEGITGALSSGGEHWLQLTIDGDAQATRERVLAVPFALRAGVANALAPKTIPLQRRTASLNRSGNRVHHIPTDVKAIHALTAFHNGGNSSMRLSRVAWSDQSNIQNLVNGLADNQQFTQATYNDANNGIIQSFTFRPPVMLDHDTYMYWYATDASSSIIRYEFQSGE